MILCHFYFKNTEANEFGLVIKTEVNMPASYVGLPGCATWLLHIIFVSWQCTLSLLSLAFTLTHVLSLKYTNKYRRKIHFWVRWIATLRVFQSMCVVTLQIAIGTSEFLCVSGCFSIGTWKSLFLFPDSDYGYERHGESQCVPAFWYNPASPSKDCSLGQSYLNSTG